MSQYNNTVSFYLEDYPRTLFPLDVNSILIQNAAKEIGQFIYQQITHISESSHSFLPQVRVYASKPRFHLRRTVKLDPIAEFYLYDLVYRHRAALRRTKQASRVSFGYVFEGGRLPHPSNSYRAFKSAMHSASGSYEYCAKFDISSYFNSVYHHDLVKWFRDIARTDDDISLFGKYLRQINSGRSTDCLPQGIVPAKIIGSHFLNFIDNSNRINSEVLFRFMDDFYLFSNKRSTLISDFLQIQRMLGEKGLSINPSKTKIGHVEHIDIEKELDEIKIGLLRRRRYSILASGEEESEDEDEDEDEDESEDEGVEDKLGAEEIDYLVSLLKSTDIEEEDAELVLSLMRDHSEDVLEHIPDFLKRFPNLSKNIFYFVSHVNDKEALGKIVLDFIQSSENVTEYQLFWLAKIVESELLGSTRCGKILISLYENPSASVISRAKVLEIPEKRFGMKDLREEHLRTGSSDWLAWASAVGSRLEKKASRDHLLGYFSNGSPMNKLIADCVMKL